MEMRKIPKRAGLMVMALAIGFAILPATNSIIGNDNGVMQVEAKSYAVSHTLKLPARLQLGPTALSGTVMKLPANANVLVRFQKGNYSYVQVKDKYGYVKTSNLKQIPHRYV